MNWPDWFGRRAAAELKNWKQVAYERELALQQYREQIRGLDDKNLRLIAQLRELDQHIYNLYQCFPDHKRMQPIVATMYKATERRMVQENDRIKNLMVGEIIGAYNEPSKAPHLDSGDRVSRQPRLTSGRGPSTKMD